MDGDLGAYWRSKAREAFAARANDLLEGTLQLTFPEGDGELVIPLPKVPG